MIDLFYRVAYRCAYKLMRVYWTVLHPATHGALVALWHDGEVLLVRNSYVPYHSLPGGYVREQERGRDAALRELNEELHISVRPEDLKLAVDHFHEWEGKREHVEIFELDVTLRPQMKVDNREVISAGFFTPAQALEQRLFPPIRLAIEQRLARAVAPPRRRETKG